MAKPTYEGSIASVTPTVCELFGIPPPADSSESSLASVMRHSKGVLDGALIERCLIYCPDALGDHLWTRFSEHRERVTKCCPHRVSVSAVIPPITPVCFASVFTGAPPEVHGIQRYERPVLTCDTLFDALARSNRRIAIVAVRNSSIDLIFRNRPLDYFSEAHDRSTTDRTLRVLRSDEHDLVVVYHQEYDDQLHRTEPFSAECVQAMERHVTSVQVLADAARSAWSRRSYAIVVAPDHGAHVNADTNRGDHGLDIPEDMSVSHWYGVFAPSLKAAV
jgi:hypothetical protein